MMFKAFVRILLIACCLSQTAIAEDAKLLTPEQTEKLIWFHGTEGVPVSVSSKANPDTRDKLRDILKTRPEKANINNVIQMLGYIGDASDVKVIGDCLDGIINDRAKKKLTKEKKDFYAAATALGVISRRGFSEAKKKAKAIVEKTPWVSFGERWYADEVLQRVPHAKYIAMDQFLQAYAVSQDPDLKKYQAVLLPKAKGATKEQLLMFDLAALEKIGEKRRLEEKKEIPKRFLALLNGVPYEPLKNKAKENDSRPLIHDDKLAATLAREAVQAYTRITMAIQNNALADMIKSEELRESLLDNGKPIAAKKWTDADLQKELSQAMEVEKAILTESAKLKNIRYENFQIQIEADYCLTSLPEKQGAGKHSKRSNVTGREMITVIFDIPNTAALYKKHIPRVSNKKTIDKKGNLRVYMKKVNGQWAWNPFGW